MDASISPRRPEAFGGRSGRRLRLSTLVRLRWLAIGGQTAAILVVGLWFDFPLPFGACFALIALSAWLNLGLRLVFPASHRLDPNWATLLLAYDILQLAGLLYLTGGLENPFAILLLGPVMVSATTLQPDKTFLLGAMTLAARDHARLRPRAAAVVSRRGVPGAAPLCRRRVGGARLRADLHGVLRASAWRRRRASSPTRWRRRSSCCSASSISRRSTGSPRRRRTSSARRSPRSRSSRNELAERDARRRPACGGHPPDPRAVAALPRDPLQDRLALHRAGRSISAACRCRMCWRRPPRRIAISASASPSRSGGEGPEPVGGAQSGPRLRPRQPRRQRRRLRRSREVRLHGGMVARQREGDDRRRRAGLRARLIDRARRALRHDAAGRRQRRPTEHDGLGLGIFIAKTLLERSGARLRLANRKSPETRRGGDAWNGRAAQFENAAAGPAAKAAAAS